MPDLQDGQSVEIKGSARQALRPQERWRRLQLHLPSLAEPVARHRAADVQTPAAAPWRPG